MPFTIIRPTPGLNTTQRIEELLLIHPQGLTVKELGNRLNRPVSMIQHCLNNLKAVKVVDVKKSPDTQQWIYLRKRQ